MQIPILIEPIAGTGFRAASGAYWALEAAAPTREEATAKLKLLIDSRLQAGAEFSSLEVNGSSHPLAPFIGMLKDDPMVEEWKAAMAEFRNQQDDES